MTPYWVAEYDNLESHDYIYEIWKQTLLDSTEMLLERFG